MAEPRTPSRISKRARYDADYNPFNPPVDNELGQRLLNDGENEHGHEQQQVLNTIESSTALRTTEEEPSIQSELEETKRLVKVFDVIDLSMTETREKLKTFYKTADETNTLLDMWIRVLSQTEHTQKILEDPAWEGQYMDEARDREYQDRRAAYQQAMEEANGNYHHYSQQQQQHQQQQGQPKRRHSALLSPHLLTPQSISPMATGSNLTPGLISGSGGEGGSSSAAARESSSSSSLYNPSSSLYSIHEQPQAQHQQQQQQQQSKPLKRSPALVAAAHAHASAIAANRKRTAAGSSALPIPTRTTASSSSLSFK